MDDSKKQFHVRLPEKYYRKLKAKCASESTTVQEYVANLVTGSLNEAPLANLLKKREIDEEDLVQTLKDCPILSDVNIYELEKLATSADVLHFSKGAIIVLEGERPSYFHIINDGIVKVFKASPSGKEFIIDIRYRGEIIGLVPALKGTPHFASTKAMKDTKVIAIRRQDFLDFMDRNPAVASKIVDLEFRRIYDLYERLMELVADNAGHRLIKTLFVLSSKYGNTLHFTHQEIAEMSGISAETATRIITQLKNAGILEPARGRVTILDKDRLRA